MRSSNKKRCHCRVRSLGHTLRGHPQEFNKSDMMWGPFSDISDDDFMPSAQPPTNINRDSSPEPASQLIYGESGTISTGESDDDGLQVRHSDRNGRLP